MRQGSQVYVEGRLQTRSFEDVDGTTRWITEVIAESVQFLGPPPAESQAEQQAEATESPKSRQKQLAFQLVEEAEIA